MSRLGGANKGGIIANLLLLGLAALVWLLPAVCCLAAGGWLSALGFSALLLWAAVGRWIWQAWRQWRQNGFDDYA